MQQNILYVKEEEFIVLKEDIMLVFLKPRKLKGGIYLIWYLTNFNLYLIFSSACARYLIFFILKYIINLYLMNKDAKIVKKRGLSLRMAFSHYIAFLWNTFGIGAQRFLIWTTYNLGFRLIVLVGIILS